MILYRKWNDRLDDVDLQQYYSTVERLDSVLPDFIRESATGQARAWLDVQMGALHATASLMPRMRYLEKWTSVLEEYVANHDLPRPDVDAWSRPYTSLTTGNGEGPVRIHHRLHTLEYTAQVHYSTTPDLWTLLPQDSYVYEDVYFSFNLPEEADYKVVILYNRSYQKPICELVDRVRDLTDLRGSLRALYLLLYTVLMDEVSVTITAQTRTNPFLQCFSPTNLNYATSWFSPRAVTGGGWTVPPDVGNGHQNPNYTLIGTDEEVTPRLLTNEAIGDRTDISIEVEADLHPAIEQYCTEALARLMPFQTIEGAQELITYTSYVTRW